MFKVSSIKIDLSKIIVSFALVTGTFLSGFATTSIGADFSDAPASYGTPNHQIVSGISIGAGDPDDEAAAQPTAKATGDDTTGIDDENGVTIPQLTQGGSYTINVSVNGAGGFLQGWIDWNADGDFSDAGEQIATNLQDDGTNGDTTSGDSIINIPVNVSATANTNRTFARFRWSTTSGLNDVDAASDGEVEDNTLFVWGDINAVTPFGSCPADGFLVEGNPSNLHFVNNSTAALNLISATSQNLNAAGFNPLDGRVYTRAVTPGNGGNQDISIMALGNGGTTAFFGTPISGMPASQSGNVGDVDGNGYLHITGAGGTNAVSVVDVTPSRPTFMTVVRVYTKTFGAGLTSANLGVDMAYRASDGLFYSMLSGTNPQLVTMNPATGQVNLVGTVNGLTGSFGAQYTFSNNQLLVIENTSGLRYRVDLANPSLPVFAAGDTALPNMANNDAAGCPNQAFLGGNISGTVFEDVNYGGGGGRSLTNSSGIPRENARVELYDASGNFVSATITDASGNYSFTGFAIGNYTVRVVNSSVSSSRSGYVSSLIPVQTFRADASSGTVVADTNRVGGEAPNLIDAGNGSTTLAALTTASTTAQSIAPVTLSSSNVSGVDFGYNFDTIVNINNSNQGSLRQFITNSNALANTGLAQTGQTAGQEVSIFMISDGTAVAGLRAGLTNQLTGGVAIITLIGSLPGINDSYTSLDGTTQTANVGNTNSGTLGSGGIVGVEAISFATIEKPEVEIVGNIGLTHGFDLLGNAPKFSTVNPLTQIVIRGFSIHGFGDRPSQGDIRIDENVSNVLIEKNMLGSTAQNYSLPVDHTRGNNVVTGLNGQVNNITIQDNLLGHCGAAAIEFYDNPVAIRGATNGVIIRRNEITQTARTQLEVYGGVLLNRTGINSQVEENLIRDSRGYGISVFSDSAGSAPIINGNFRNNTIQRTGIGVFFYTDGTNLPSNFRVEKNIISNTTIEAGIFVQGICEKITITQNSLFQNKNLGIDLLTTATGVTANDGVIGGSFPNNGQDYPIITSTALTPSFGGATLTASGYVGNIPAGSSTFANATLEFFIADNDGDNNGEAILGDGKNLSHGEGITYLGTCNADANSLFNCTFSNAGALGLTNANNITATATDANGNTSEFGVVSLPVTAAEGEITGTVKDTNGKPLARIAMKLIDLQSGAVKRVLTNRNGDYSFIGNQVGQGYIIQPDTISGGTFSPAEKFVQLFDSIEDADFIANGARSAQRQPFNDFDGDGKFDAAVFRETEGNWYIRQSSDETMKVIRWGTAGDLPVAADYDGDGVTDVAVFRQGIWYILRTSDSQMQTLQFGLTGDKPVVADFDGDGKADIAVYRANEGNWYIAESGNANSFKVINFGLATDKPAPEDFDGDGKADIAVYRANEGNWYISESQSGEVKTIRFGLEEDKPVAADFDGDGRADIAVYRASNGTWYRLNSQNGTFETAILGGQIGDIALQADTDGDEKADAIIYRNGKWLMQSSKDGTEKSFDFGLATDKPAILR